MKVGFIQAFSQKHKKAKPQPSLAFGYIISYIEKYLGFDNFVIKDDIDELIEEKPDLVGISSYTMYFHIAQEYAQKVKEKLGVPVIIGGHHITALPHTLPLEFDIGVLGEGEETMMELIDVFIKDKGFTPASLEKIKGIVYNKDGERIINPPRELIEPLDRIPPPKRDIFDWGPHFFILTSRGCPYRCIFCSPTIHWKKFRAFSPEYVVREVEEAFTKYKQRAITFNDDLFIADLKRFSKVVNLIQAKGLDKELYFGFSARANLVKKQLCEIMKRIRTLIISIGMESGSDRVLKYLKSEPISIEDNQRAVDLCNEYGIKIQASFIVLSPYEEREDLLKTYEFIFKNRDVYSEIRILPLTPLPGTQIWEYAKSRGLVDDVMDWRLIQLGKLNLNEKINKYEFYRFLQSYFKLIKYYNIDTYYAFELIFPLRVAFIPEDEDLKDIWI